MEPTTRSIRFKPDLYNKLVEASDELHVSLNWLVNKLCEEGLEHIVNDLKVTT